VLSSDNTCVAVPIRRGDYGIVWNEMVDLRRTASLVPLPHSWHLRPKLSGPVRNHPPADPIEDDENDDGTAERTTPNPKQDERDDNPTIYRPQRLANE
jgi:hypothetical protein